LPFTSGNRVLGYKKSFLIFTPSFGIQTSLFIVAIVVTMVGIKKVDGLLCLLAMFGY
jgi:hypothetical protein